jgi:Outer membrane lipoprotein-sorting protein
VTLRQISCGLFLLIAAMASAPARGASTTPSLGTIVARMAEARVLNRNRMRSYVITRDYTLFGKERDKSKSEVTAEVSFVPPDSKKFTIRQSSGSGLGVRLVRRMLEGETEIVGDRGATDISTANYDFRFVGEETLNNQRCYVLEILPKREHKTLLRGNVWVDANSFLLHRMEGEPAKSPSWWLKDVHIALFYGNVDGMWMQTSSEVTTNVRIVGQHTMIAHDVGYERPAPAGPALLGLKTFLPFDK